MKRPGFQLGCALVLAAALLAAADGRAEEVYQPNPNPPTDGLVGSNYTPAYAVNQVQFWHDFRPDVVEKELAAAKKYFGLSTLRVFLHDINFFQEKQVLLANLETFLGICDRHGIRPGFVFFDSCHRHEGITLDRPTEPVQGFHNGRWAQSPQARDIEKDNLEKFKPYVQEVIRPHRTDARVLFWEVHNEPAPGDAYRDRLKRAGYAWAKEVGPAQPVLNCEKGKLGWADCEASDIVDAHFYSNAHGPLRDLADCNPAKGTVFTEAGARWKAARRNFGGPVDIVFWLARRRQEGKSTPGAYLCWELMVGNSNCRWHWVDTGHERGSPDPEPEIPWCGLLWPDATPVSLAEAEAVRRYATGRSTALFFEDFELHNAAVWKVYGKDAMPVRNAASLEPGMKAVAGDAAWTDYVLEGQVVLRPGKEKSESGDAGLLVRVSDPGDALDAMRGYAVTFGGGRLVLGRIEKGRRRELATFDLAALKTPTRDNEWSLIRIAAEGPRIRVWFNRLHPSSDPDNGLRIDFTDADDPIRSGAIGVMARSVAADFDNLVVLPVDALPPSALQKPGPESSGAGPADRGGWTQSYKAGYADSGGAYAGGSEIMHLVPHGGKLYAANGYWTDARWAQAPDAEKQSAQVLRLDSADGRWAVDLDLGRSNGLGLRYMKGHILKSVAFTRDGSGRPLPQPRRLLVMAAGAYVGNEGVVSAWVRDDASGAWRHGVAQRGPRAGGARWVPRDLEVHRDAVTGAERLFLLLGDPGLLAGVYDEAQPGRIRWDDRAEFPADGAFPARPLGLAVANGALHVSAAGTIYRRADGPKPAYSEVLNLGGGVNADAGGIRGLTPIANPNGTGESLLFLWAPDGRSEGRIKRLDPDGAGGYVAHDEASVRDLMRAKLDVEVGYVLGAHNAFYPVVHPATGATVHLVGFQGILRGREELTWPGSRLYAGALYAVRAPDGTYAVHEVDGPWAPGKPVLVAPRAFALSPFGDGAIYVGGHDASFQRSDDRAWIFRAPVKAVLGLGDDP